MQVRIVVQEVVTGFRMEHRLDGIMQEKVEKVHLIILYYRVVAEGSLLEMEIMEDLEEVEDLELGIIVMGNLVVVEVEVEDIQVEMEDSLVQIMEEVEDPSMLQVVLL
jgi:metal-sulfur cluster biosynthetic enzyme